MRGVGAADAQEIRDVLARHALMFDNRAWDTASHGYTADAGLGGAEGDLAPVSGLSAAERSPQVYFPHHTTDTVLHAIDSDTVRAWSKYFVIRGDGTAGSGDYQDTVVRTPEGWRIAERRVSRGSRPDTDPDGPSTRELTVATWRAAQPRSGG
jgi:3-phenylpropionate/cinnamic acid dioxygenase small subunit